MTITLQTVNELIQSLESGELSIKETKVMALAKAYLDVAAENVGLNSFIVDACWIVDDGQYCDATDFMPETPVTDRLLAEAEARGVEKFAEWKKGVAEAYREVSPGCAGESEARYAEIEAFYFAKQLREGADK